MAIQKMKWVAQFGYRILGFPNVRFKGRDPFTPANDAHKKVLLDLGVFEDLGNGTLRYSAPVKITYVDGKKIFIDKDGIVEYDPDLLSPEKAQPFAQELTTLDNVK